MNDLLQPGQHLDPDQLNAFLEGMLPEHERMQSLAHLADCEHCRQVVFLAQQTRQAEEPVPVKAAPAWRNWFRFSPLSMLSAASAALVCALIVTVTLHLHRSAPTPATTETARVESNPSLPPAAQREEAPPVIASAPARDMANKAAPPPPTPSVSAPLAPKARSRTDEPTGGTAGVPTSPARSVNAMKADSAIDGAGIDNNDPRMHMQFRRVEPGAMPKPAVPSAPLPSTSNTLAQAPTEKLPIAAGGAVASEHADVTVAATADTISTADAADSISSEVKAHTLPSKLPIVTTVSSNGLTLAADSDGTLFFSKHGEEHWKAVKQQWQGKVTQLELAPQTEAKGVTDSRTVVPSGFQLTTEAGVVWVSGDGVHWRQR